MTEPCLVQLRGGLKDLAYVLGQAATSTILSVNWRNLCAVLVYQNRIPDLPKLPDTKSPRGFFWKLEIAMMQELD